MIPLQIARKIRPRLSDPIKHSVIYSFSDHDIVERSDDYTLYAFPHSPCTYWTNFKFTQPIVNDLWIEVIVITSEGTTYSISAEAVQNRWHSMYWALPSINSNDQSGYYFKIHHEPGTVSTPLITLLGFIELYQLVPMYALVDTDDICRFIVFRDDTTTYENNKHSIRQWTVESVEEATKIKPVSCY